MKKLIFYTLLFLVGCKSLPQSSVSLTNTIDFKSWHNTVMDSFENKTGYSKGAKRDYGTAYGVVYSVINNYSETKLKELFDRSNAKNGDWDRMFILDLFMEGETSYEITSILLYKNSKYYGVSFDGNDFYNIKYTPNFKPWKLKPKFEYLSNSYIVVSEFDKSCRNIANKLFIGPPFDDVTEKVLKIYDSKIFD
ncbi:MAG: hypothetical protein KIS77_13250 [Saprospiraceae bacterium]|nr:hypothetical protein [Saprospiraceae bacterium]